MRDQLTNAICGVLDYAAYPIGMLLVAPIILHKLGSSEYGLWVFATALVSSGSIIASGFGDANIQRIAVLRSSGAKAAIETMVRSMVGINLLVGLLLTLVGWLIAPSAARHVAASSNLRQECLLSLRIASFLMTVRALESVSISTLRAFERFGAAVGISVFARLMTLGAAVLLAYHGHGTASIMEATAALLVLGTSAQFFHLRRFLGVRSLWPQFDRSAVTSLFDFGIYSWIQAVAGVIFGQIDRLLLGISFGASAVASYALCVQMAQPIYGFAAAGLHFLFPYLAGRTISSSNAELWRVIRNAFIWNLLFVTASSALLLIFGDRVLRAWAGNTIAQSAAPIFPLIVFGSALLGLSVTGAYAMLALGLVRSVAWFSIAGGGLMLLMMELSVHRSGIRGFAIARFWYGLVALLLYLPLLRRLSKPSSATTISSAVTLAGLEEITLQ